jgi:hypothetical protein
LTGEAKLACVAWSLVALRLREDDYVTAKATTPDEVEELAREGFTYVSEIQGVQIFRKQRWLVEEPFSGKVH